MNAYLIAYVCKYNGLFKLIHHAVNSITNAPFIPNKALVLCMEPIAACLALGDRLSWKMNDKYLVRMGGRPRPLHLLNTERAR